jgi:glycosyltransferase involved in cell wall biosynthesis
MEKKISIVIPNYNKASAVGKSLQAAFASNYRNFEVVVVDDCSEDNSVEIIKKFPCKLICLKERSGTSHARNTGARNCSGDIVFFTDADCLLCEDALSRVNDIFSSVSYDVIVGGTYTELPYDKQFFSVFQSVFINYSETKRGRTPDYIAAHAMIMYTRTFMESGGFPENFMPILEDVEFSHRMRRQGYRLVMAPDIQVQHIFAFSLLKSLHNAFRKSKYWVTYSHGNRDLLSDSGTASTELKINVVSYFCSFLLLVLWIILNKNGLLVPIIPLLFCNALVSRNLLKSFYRARGGVFAGLAFLYYAMLYPVPVGLGTTSGTLSHFLKK